MDIALILLNPDCLYLSRRNICLLKQFAYAYTEGMKKPLKLTLIAAPIALIGLGAAVWVSLSGITVSRQSPPKFLTHDVVDPAQIYAVSKFRSGEGHDFSGAGETCRSMKHYLMPQMTLEDVRYMQEHQGMFRSPDGKTDLTIYAPANGTVTQIVEEHTPIGRQVYFAPDAATMTVRLFHIYPKDGLKAGQHVSSGEQLGVVPAGQTFDVSVQYGRAPFAPDEYVSYFDVMPDNLFAAWQARGIKDRAQVIISRAERDANPFQCGSGDQREMFVHPANYDADADDVHLSGYVKVVDPGREQAQQQNNQQNGGRQ